MIIQWLFSSQKDCTSGCHAGLLLQKLLVLLSGFTFEFFENIFIGSYFNKILWEGFIVWLLSKTVVLELSELPGGLAPHTEILVLWVWGES